MLEYVTRKLTRAKLKGFFCILFRFSVEKVVNKSYFPAIFKTQINCILDPAEFIDC